MMYFLPRKLPNQNEHMTLHSSLKQGRGPPYHPPESLGETRAHTQTPLTDWQRPIDDARSQNGNTDEAVPV